MKSIYLVGGVSLKGVLTYLDNLLKSDDIVVLGCSGGPDTMALLNILLGFRTKKNLRIVCAHVNHNIRPESAEELLFLKDYCKKNHVIFESMVISKYGDDNFHNEARNIRYHFFEELVFKYNASYLMTAHHGDDLIETILMRIVRGPTLVGYSGFAKEVKKDNYTLVRPLITVTKQDILDYLKALDVPYVLDASNSSSKYTRNRYRKEIIPFLKIEDSRVHEKFLKYSNTLLMYDKYINKITAGIISNVYDGNGSLNILEFKKLDEVLQNKIIYYILEKYYPDDLILIRDAHVDLIKKLIFSNKANARISLPNNIVVVKEYNNLLFSLETTLIDNYEIEISDYVKLPDGKAICIVSDNVKNDNNYCRLSASSVSFPLIVRTRRAGDRMAIKGSAGTKKIKDIFIDAKVPKSKRDLWPIVTDSTGKIVWVPGLKKSKFDIPKDKKCDIILRYCE